MKTARILFTIAGFGAFTFGLCYAAEPSQPPAEQDSRQIHATGNRPANRIHDSRTQADPKPAPLNHNSRASERSSPAGPIHTRTKHPSGNDLHQPGLKKAAPAANGGLMMSKTGNHCEQPAKLALGSGRTASLPGGVRTRSAAAAAIGGMAAASAKHSAAALNGADFMKPKP
jgi:hypothetical protein